LYSTSWHHFFSFFFFIFIQKKDSLFITLPIRESRRKTPLAVSLRNGEREFGEMALQQSVKHPKSAYLFLTQLLAKSLDNPAVVAYKEKYPFYDIKEDPVTKTIYFQHDE
jgi:hypoxia up-regulated 1